MKLKKYILIGIIIIFSIIAILIGKDMAVIKSNALENNIEINEKDILNKNVQNKDEKLSKEDLKIKEIILNDKSGLFKLVNEEHPIDKNYAPEKLVTPNIALVGVKNEPRSKVSSIIKEPLEKMFQDAKKEGVELYLSCAYRSFDEQEYLYNRALKRENRNSSDLVALPGRSEHQLGLAVDITTKKLDFQLEEAFEDTKEGQWLLNNAYKYGFIFRYHRGKENITGYTYEPWHYRYIGNLEVSKYCHDNNLTLEEIYKKLGINTK